MHYTWLHISIFIGVAFLVATVIFTPIIKYRRNIKKWWKNNGVWKFIVTVLVPFALPFIITLVLYFTDSYKANLDTPKIKEPILLFMIAVCVIAFINLCFQFYYWKKEKNDKKIEWENAIYRHAYYSLYDALNAKTTKYRTAAIHNKNNSLKEIVGEYDAFDHIRDLCIAFRRAVSGMTDIPTTHIAVSFIYHYTYTGANYKDKEWRWIIGKDSNCTCPLESIINKEESMFHHLISNNREFEFYNDKRDAASARKYFLAEKDRLYNDVGSVFASKFAFTSNSQMCCEGLLMISSYGHKFIRDDSKYTPDEFRKILEQNIFPCYKKLLKAELGWLYFRHEDEDISEA